jgi:hypothetical protein
VIIQVCASGGLKRESKFARAGVKASPQSGSAGEPAAALFAIGFQRRSLSGVPPKPCLGVSSFGLLIFEGWPRRTPFSHAEKPPIAFICELKKQVRIGLDLRGGGQSAISDRAGIAHGISNPRRRIAIRLRQCL